MQLVSGDLGRRPIKPMRFCLALVYAGALSLLAFPAQANQMFRAGKQWNFLSFWLSIPRQWLLQAHKAELPVLPRWRQQWDVLPQWISIQGQWLLPSALGKAEIHPLALGQGREERQLTPWRLRLEHLFGSARWFKVI